MSKESVALLNIVTNRDDATDISKAVNDTLGGRIVLPDGVQPVVVDEAELPKPVCLQSLGLPPRQQTQI